MLPITIMSCFKLMLQFNAAEVAFVVGLVKGSRADGNSLMLAALWSLGKVMVAIFTAGGALAGGGFCILIVGMVGAGIAAGGALTAAIILILPCAYAAVILMGAGEGAGGKISIAQINFLRAFAV